MFFGRGICTDGVCIFCYLCRLSTFDISHVTSHITYQIVYISYQAMEVKVLKSTIVICKVALKSDWFKIRWAGGSLFKASALRAYAFYKSKCPSVCVSVCSLLRYRLTVFLPPLPEVGCPIFLEIRNPCWKVLERSGLRYEHFSWKIVLNRRAKKSFFLHFFRSSSVFGLFLSSFCPHFLKSDVQYF